MSTDSNALSPGHPPTLVMLISIALAGCSGLTRDSAAEKIANRIKLNPVLIGMDKALTPKIGHIEANCFGSTIGISSAYDPIEKDQGTLALSQAGFLTIKNSGEHKWDVLLTDEGKKSIKDKPYAHEQIGACDFWQVSFPTAALDSVNVTGIQEEGAHARVEANMTWKPTPLGFALKKLLAQQHRTPEESEAILGDERFARMSVDSKDFKTFHTFLFEKYDDGWRIK